LRRRSRENSLAPSAASSGIGSPSNGRKHIHFNEQVEQCIAIDVKGDDDEEDDYGRFDHDSDSDDAIMIKTRRPTRLRTIRRRPIKVNTTDSKTIAILPSTTLKYREDTPEPQETAMKHGTNPYQSPVISPSSSQETLRPSKKSGRFSMVTDDSDDEESSEDDDEDKVKGKSRVVEHVEEDEDEEEADEDEDEDENEPTPRASRLSKPTSGLKSSSSGGLQRSSSTSSLNAEPAGMRRTSSGMFMPYEEEEPPPNLGVIGRVIDTVNTARDIAHVMWNVGWTR
jgi:hypothetical protein